MKILLINHYAGGPAYGMEYRPYHLAREWSRLGHEVTIVGATYSHLRYRNPHATASKIELVDGIRMIWLSAPSYRGNGIARAVNILTFATRLMAASGGLARRIQPNLVITSSTHPMDVYAGSRIRRLTGGTWFHEVHDLWPLTLVELGGMPRWHPFIALLQAAEDHAYRKADRVVSMLPAALPYMEGRGLDSARFQYVPNGVAVDDWRYQEPLPTGHLEVLNRLQTESRFIVGYAGGFALSNDLVSFLESLRHLQRSDVHFVLVGDGEHRGELERRYAGERITFLPSVPKAVIPSVLERFDACFVGYKRSSLYRFGVNPNKMFDYMMAARPIICAIEAANDPVGEIGAGLTVQPEDPAAIAHAIELLAAEPDRVRKARGEKARQYVLERYDYRVLAAHFLQDLPAGTAS